MVPVEVELGDLVEDVKQTVRKKLEVRGKEQRLLLDGKDGEDGEVGEELEDQRSLESYIIWKGDTFLFTNKYMAWCNAHTQEPGAHRGVVDKINSEIEERKKKAELAQVREA